MLDCVWQCAGLPAFKAVLDRELVLMARTQMAYFIKAAQASNVSFVDQHLALSGKSCILCLFCLLSCKLVPTV